MKTTQFAHQNGLNYTAHDTNWEPLLISYRNSPNHNLHLRFLMILQQLLLWKS